MKNAVVLAVLAASLVIAASILLIGRYQISAVGYGYGYSNAGTLPNEDVEEKGVFRLDRWTGAIDYCRVQVDPVDIPKVTADLAKTGALRIKCR